MYLQMFVFEGMNGIINDFEKDFPMGVVMIAEKYQACNYNDWISKEKAKIGHLYYVKFGKIAEFQRMKNKSQSYVIISPKNLIEPLQPVRKHKKMLMSQFSIFNQIFIESQCPKHPKLSWFYGSFNHDLRSQHQRMINGSGCVLIHYCDQTNCDNPKACYQHINVNDPNVKLPSKWELECHCGFGLNDLNNDKICLQSSLQGLIKSFLYHGQSAQSVLQPSFLKWLCKMYGVNQM